MVFERWKNYLHTNRLTMKKLIIFSLLIFLFFKGIGQDYASNNFEFGTGLLLETDRDRFNQLFIPIYAKWAYEPYVNSEFGAKLQWNAKYFGNDAMQLYFRGIGSFPGSSNERELITRDIDVASKNLFSIELYGLKRMWIFKKQRFLGLGLNANYSNITHKLLKEESGWRGSRPLKGWSIGTTLKWQEQCRNLIHSFDFYFNIKSHEDLFDLDPVNNYLSYTIGYRIPFKKPEVPDEEDLIGWKSIIKDSNFYQVNLTVGADLHLPVNFNANAASARLNVELRYRWAQNYEVGAGGSIIESSTGIGLDRNPLDARSFDSGRFQNISSHVSNYYVLGHYYFEPTEYDLFVGAGLGFTIREEMFPHTIFDGQQFTESFLYPTQTNFGFQIRGGYQIGKLRHTIAFNLAGKYIPDFFSSTIGVNIGGNRKK